MNKSVSLNNTRYSNNPNSNLQSEIRLRLKEIRQESGYATAKEFAEKNNLKISTYTLHEAGTRKMSLEIIEYYAYLLKVNINWLICGIGIKKL